MESELSADRQAAATTPALAPAQIPLSFSLVRPVFILAIAFPVLHAEPIEIPADPQLTDPFTGTSLEAFRAGSPPSYRGNRHTNLGAVSRKPTLWFGDDDGSFGLAISPSFLVVQWDGSDSLTKVQPRFSRTEGLFILRDEQGRVAQVWSDVTVTELKYLPTGWRETMWQMHDTEYGGDIPGGRKPIEGREPVHVFEDREIKQDPASGLREILSISIYKDLAPQVTKTTYRNGAKRALMISETYVAKEDAMIPANLTYRQSYQRIYWPEGPGFIELKTDQKKNADGEFDIVLDVEERWKVDETGARKLDSRAEKNIPGLRGR